jgi:uncharacterized protein (UPF0333 family)
VFIKMNRKGQSTLEYGILIAVVVGALIAMSVYMKRGLQGRLRSSTDQLGEQYSAGQTQSQYTITSDSTTKETNNAGVTSTQITKDTSGRTGSESVGDLSTETLK